VTDAALLARLAAFPQERTDPAPDAVARWADAAFDVRIAGKPTETTAEEINVALPMPGGDAWLTIDRTTGETLHEKITRGWVAWLNDLHADGLRDLRAWWRKGGRAMAMPADGISGPTKAPGRHAVNVPGARLRNLPDGQYTLVVEAAREMGGRASVRVPFRWGAANTASGTGSSELGAVRVAVTR
jgi:hypothetical protein